MNQVNESLRCIKDSIEYHEHEITKLNNVRSAVHIKDSLNDLKDFLFECIDFKLAFHEHQLDGLKNARDEIMDKNNICRDDGK